MAASAAYSGGELTLTPDGGTAIGELSFSVAAADTGKLHHMKFEVDGLPGDTVYCRMGSSSGASNIHVCGYRTGVHLMQFTPNATTVYLQFRCIAPVPVKVKALSILSNAVLELETPWSDGILPELRSAQSNDVLTLTHPSTHPRDLIRYGDFAFSLEQFPNEDGPYLDENTDDTLTLSLSDVTGVVTATASRSMFRAGDYGRHIAIRSEGEWGWGVIRGVISTTQVTLEIKKRIRQAPDFGAVNVVLPTWEYSTDGTAITAVTIPAATGGFGTLSYSAVGVPAGIAFNKNTRVLSGTPAGVGSGTIRVTVEDENGDTDTLEFGFSIVVPDTSDGT